MTFFILIRHPQDEGNNNFSSRMSSFLLKKIEVKGFLFLFFTSLFMIFFSYYFSFILGFPSLIKLFFGFI
jgi:hypothetical protein